MLRSSILAASIAVLASGSPTPLAERGGLSIPVAKTIASLKKITGAKAPSSSALLVHNTAKSGSTKLIPAEEGDGYAIDVCFGGQTFSAILDTGSSDLWLPEAGFQCVNLNKKKVPAADCAFGPLHNGGFEEGQIANENFNITYGDGEFLTGNMGYEEVSVAGITVQKQEVALVDYAYWFGDNVTSGLMGFAYPSLTSAYKGTDPTKDNQNTTVVPYNPWIFNAINEGQVENNLFSLAIERTPEGGTGQLAIGGLPSIPFDHTFTSVPLKIIDLIADSNTDHHYSFYTVIPDGISATGTSGKVNTKTTFPAIVDSGTTLIYVPGNFAAQINALYDPPSKYIKSEGVYENKCSGVKVPTFGITIGGTTFMINPKDMLLTGNSGFDPSTGLCLTGVQPGGSGPSILGDVFLKNVVAVFDIGKEQMHFAPHVDYTA